MEAEINLKSKLQSLRVAQTAGRGPTRSHDAVRLAGRNHRSFVGAAIPEEFFVVADRIVQGHGIALEHGCTRVCSGAVGLFDAGEIFKRTPYIADLKPGGQVIDKELFEAGDIPFLKTLLDNGFLHGECLTVSGYSMAENLDRVAWKPEQEAVRPAIDRDGRGVRQPRAGRRHRRSSRKFSGPYCFEPYCFESVPVCSVRGGGVIKAERDCTDVQSNNAELEMRRAVWQPHEPACRSGYHFKFARRAGAPPRRHPSGRVVG